MDKQKHLAKIYPIVVFFFYIACIIAILICDINLVLSLLFRYRKLLLIFKGNLPHFSIEAIKKLHKRTVSKRIR